MPSLYVCVCVCVCVYKYISAYIYLHTHTQACSYAQSCLTLCDPMDCSLPGSSAHGIFQARTLGTVVCQAPLSIGLSRQELWSELPCPHPRDLPNPGIEPGSPALEADSLPPEPPGKPYISVYICHTHIYIHIYTEREREREREKDLLAHSG